MMELNGVLLDQLQATVKAVTAQPELARFEFRSKTRWQQGASPKPASNRFTAQAMRTTHAPNRL